MYAKKRSGKKIAAMLLAFVLLIGVGVGGTLAWLSAVSGTVTNTFTVGEITIDLKEHKLGADGKLTTEEVSENNTYKIVPGGSQPKDPFVTVTKGSEKCYVYVLVTNNLKDYVTTDISNTEWASITTSTDGKQTLYRYIGTDADASDIVDASANSVKLEVFNNVKYVDTISKDTFTNFTGDKTITVQAFAHQSDNTDQATADKAAADYFKLTLPATP